MKKNLGNMDKTIRIVLAIVMGALVSIGIAEGIFSYVLLTLSIYFATTSLSGFCPIYYLLGFKTISENEDKNNETE